MIEEYWHQRVLEVRMSRPPANAFNQSLVSALIKAVEEGCEAGASAIVISGREGMFSGGLDVPELLQLDRNGVYAFWSGYMLLNRMLATSAVPVVAAITGHSPAGGAVLAIHCDYRIAAAGRFKLGFNEVRVGLPVPRTVLLALESLVGYRRCRDLAMGGVLVSPEQALADGLVDEVVAPDRVIPRAIEWATELSLLPPIAMNQTRKLVKAAFLEQIEAADDARVATEFWFSDETRMQMQRLVDALRR